MIWAIPVAATLLGGGYLYEDATESEVEAAGLTGDDALEYMRLQAEIEKAKAREAEFKKLFPLVVGGFAAAGVGYFLWGKK